MRSVKIRSAPFQLSNDTTVVLATLCPLVLGCGTSVISSSPTIFPMHTSGCTYMPVEKEPEDVSGSFGLLSYNHLSSLFIDYPTALSDCPRAHVNIW